MSQTPPHLERLSLPEMVYRDLREAIMDGVFAPGQVLRQEDIARRFGVSRAPLREALPRLEADGVVVFNPRRGYMVTALDVDDIHEIFRLRALVEQDAARLSATQRTKEDIARAKALLDALAAQREVTDPASFAAWSKSHFAFHRALIEPAGHQRHIKIADSLRTQVEWYIRMEIALTGNTTQSLAEHRRMFQAFKAGDADKLAQLVSEHCEHTSERLIRAMNAQATRAAETAGAGKNAARPAVATPKRRVANAE